MQLQVQELHEQSRARTDGAVGLSQPNLAPIERALLDILGSVRTGAVEHASWSIGSTCRGGLEGPVYAFDGSGISCYSSKRAVGARAAWSKVRRAATALPIAFASSLGQKHRAVLKNEDRLETFESCHPGLAGGVGRTAPPEACFPVQNVDSSVGKGAGSTIRRTMMSGIRRKRAFGMSKTPLDLRGKRLVGSMSCKYPWRVSKCVVA